MYYFAIFCLCSRLVSGSFLETLENLSDVPTVKELELNKYLGLWYQMYASQSVMDWFEEGAMCVTANYSLPSDGTNHVTVLNAERLDKPNGKQKLIHGYAVPSDDPGKLTVTLETVKFPTPYWVMKLGPETFGPNGQYQYSLVSDFAKATLFVLARDPSTFKQFEPEVLQFLKGLGFTSIINKPIKTYHGSDCVY